MSLIDLSLARPVFAWMLMSAMIVFGAVSLNRLGVSQMPDVDFPIINVQVTYDGAAPEVVETEILDGLESRLLNIEGIKEMRSSATQGQGSITLEFDIKRDVNVALQEVQSALAQFRLPVGVDPPLVRKTNPEEDPILFISIYGPQSLAEKINWINNFLLDQLRFLPGVGEVSIGGFSERNLRVWPDPEKLRASNLSVLDVVDAIDSQHLETAAGQFSDDKRELRVRWLGEAATPEKLAKLEILRRGGQTIFDRVYRVGDVAKVEDGLSDIRRVAKVNGIPAITIAVKKQRGTNEVEVAQNVKTKLAELQGQFPQDLKYRINVDLTRPTAATVFLTKEKLVVAALITILVCFLFLGSFSAAVNILFSIPTSVLGTFIVLYFSGFTLNTFTLLALTLSVSIVVDDAIMLLENIVRHHRMGKSALDAARDGSKEVMPAATAATLAVVAVFLPVVFMDGVIGKFFFQFGITMSAAVLLSLVEAQTITPMRAAQFLRSGAKSSKLEEWLDQSFSALGDRYRDWLEVSLRHSWKVLGVSFALFFGSLYLFKRVRQEFVPPQDQDFIIIAGQAPVGSSLPTTLKFADRMENVVKADPAVEGFVTSVGVGGPSSSPNQIFMPVALKPRSERADGHLIVMKRLREQLGQIKAVRVVLRDISSRNLTSGRLNPIAFNVRGPDLDLLQKKADEIMTVLQQEGYASDLDKDFRMGLPELRIEPSRRAMAQRGVASEQVARTLGVAMGTLRSGKFTADGRRYDIRYKVPEDLIRHKEDIARIGVRNLYGNLVPLSELVEFSEGTALQSISRINRQRAISVFGNLGPGQSQAAVLDKIKDVGARVLPDGYSIGFEGAAAGFGEAFRSLVIALVIGVLVAYMILGSQFNSFLHPVTILLALPFSLTGAVLALWIFDVSINLFSFIGLIVLMGIAKKNSIMLVEFTNHVRKQSLVPAREALLEACPVRLRPILMTSAATIFAALPLVLGSGLGFETRLPMGLAIIGGTLVSTVFTLFVIPAFYLKAETFNNTRRSV